MDLSNNKYLPTVVTADSMPQPAAAPREEAEPDIKKEATGDSDLEADCALPPIHLSNQSVGSHSHCTILHLIYHKFII